MGKSPFEFDSIRFILYSTRFDSIHFFKLQIRSDPIQSNLQLVRFGSVRLNSIHIEEKNEVFLVNLSIRRVYQKRTLFVYL